MLYIVVLSDNSSALILIYVSGQPSILHYFCFVARMSLVFWGESLQKKL